MLRYAPIKTVVSVFLSTWLAACGNSDLSSPGAQPGAPPPAPASPNSPASATAMVSIPANATGMGVAAFGQNLLVIQSNTRVTWTNADAMVHTVTSDTGIFDSGTLATGKSFTYVFATPGTFPYSCTIHGKVSMSGVVKVTP